MERNKQILEQFLQIADSRYAVGQGSQADVLKAQTQLSKMVDELIKLARERSFMEAELSRALGRATEPAAPVPEAPELREVALQLAPLRESALRDRPQLLGSRARSPRQARRSISRARTTTRTSTCKVFYGQRDNMPMGENRDRHGEPDRGDQPAGMAREQARPQGRRGDGDARPGAGDVPGAAERGRTPSCASRSRWPNRA